MKATNWLPRLWQFLTEPHPSLTNIEQRRQAQLLAGFTLTLTFLPLLASILLIVSHTAVQLATLKILWGAILLTFGLYWLNRNGRYRLAAILFVGVNFFLVFLLPFLIHDLSWLLFANMVILLAALLLPEWATYIFFAGLCANLIFAFFAPIQATFNNIAFLVMYLITGPLVLVFMNHQTSLEKERRQELQTANLALQRSEAELEQRVFDRTRDLKVASEVARQVTTVLNLEHLLPELVEKTKEAFALYSVSVFLYQPESQRLILTAGTGQAGLQMKAEGFAFHIQDRPSLVARAAREQKNLVINDVSQETAYAHSDHLPHTKSEMVLPMLVDHHLIGVLNLDSDHLNHFQPADVDIFSTLAEQIAIAVNNARLYAAQTQLAESLRQANQAKSQFLSNMSHELRTPLNGILGYTQILHREPNLTPRQIEGLNVIQQSGEHLLTLIKDILDLSKIEAGRLELHPNAFYFPTFLKTILDMAAMRAQQKGLRFVHTLDGTLPQQIEADETRLRQILLNLLGNAIKFTEAGEIHLHIAPTAKGSGIRFVVSDTGIGIANADLLKIFEPFEQIKNAQNWNEGTGLGLSITKQLVATMGGDIQVTSTVGEGSTFTVELPLVLLETPMAELPPPQTPIIGYHGPRRKILIVDDKLSNRLVLRNMLEPLGFAIFLANDGQEGLQIAQACLPDLILLDLIMPNTNGLEMVRALRQEASLQNTVVIAVSASVLEKEQEISRAAGCTDFLPKPIREGDLFALLARYLGIQWEYQAPPFLNIAEEPLVTEATAVPLPPLSDLQTLLHLAERGNLRAVRQQAEKIRQQNGDYAPFCQKLEQLAKGFAEKELIQLLKTHLPTS